MTRTQALRVQRSWTLVAMSMWLCAACHGNDSSAPGTEDGGAVDLGSGEGSGDLAAGSYPYTLSPQNPSFKVSWASGSLDCTMTAVAMAQSGAASVTFGSSTIYVGWKQVSGTNQDPFIARVDGGAVSWCLAAEAQSPDGRAHGVAWDGGSLLYAVYTVVGGGTAFDGKGGWLPAYGSIGSGGGSTVAVLAKHDPATGALQRATFIPSQLASTGKVNTLSPRGFTVLANGSIEFLGSPAFSPLNPDKSRMCVSGSEYPNGYLVRFPADLSTPSCAQTESCSQVKQRCP